MESKRFLVVADTHGDMIDPATERAIFSLKKEFRPQILIHAGDLFDFRNLRKGASEEEKRHSMKEDRAMGFDFAKRFFEGGEIKRQLWGNHDKRIFDAAENAQGILRDYAAKGANEINDLMADLNVKTLPYDARLGVLRIGKMSVIHGYAAGINAARRHAQIYGNCFFGHTHNCDVAGAENVNGISEARGIGASCKIDMPYNATQTSKLRHQNAFVYGLLFSNGTFQANQAKKIGGHFHVASDFRTL